MFGELVCLNINDINFYERECVVYFDARTKIHLMEYLQSRDDENPAIFVSLNKISGIEK